MRFGCESGKPVWRCQCHTEAQHEFRLFFVSPAFSLRKLKQSVKFSAGLSNTYTPRENVQRPEWKLHANCVSIKSYNNCCKHKFCQRAYVLKLNRKSLQPSSIWARLICVSQREWVNEWYELCLLREREKMRIEKSLHQPSAANYGPNLLLIYCVGFSSLVHE